MIVREEEGEPEITGCVLLSMIAARSLVPRHIGLSAAQRRTYCRPCFHLVGIRAKPPESLPVLVSVAGFYAAMTEIADAQLWVAGRPCSDK